MTGATHKKFAVAAAFTASAVLYKNGLTEVNYYLTIPILLASAKYGALFPDIDHTWQNVKEKTIPNRIINGLIHITGGKHRSWQTHSIDIAIIFSLMAWFIPNMLMTKELISTVNYEVIRLLLYGFMFGWISHLISDMLTSAGVRVLCFSKIKLALVPKHIGKLRFNTGNEWEQFVYRVVSIINVIYGLIILVYPIITDQDIQNLVHKIIGG